jgi:hypothetical protein
VYDGLFQELLVYVDKSLDSPYGIQGFCEFFASKSSSEKETVQSWVMHLKVIEKTVE